MQFNQMMSLAAIAVIMSVIFSGTNGQIHNKPIECCTSVSDKEITLPITGFRLQKRNPPCVNAVIFFTAEGQRCSHWKESWVKQKIQELKKIQLQERGTKMNSTDSTPSPYNSTVHLLRLHK
ncbi:chemokine (C-C motif) ligand 34a, duplicate 3 isoform X2 [Carassius carassius]|uniref:chemokine (C-C motif) ligand 34a, duplicate 3 isoform X2 n=1 Tax=Carassius carassius TaxID=217509 RepID=UPI0028694884|nr:chemokine (C-C motif) ligand 34a, duplicate 3 isoform X2 [Carassius carassius]